VGSDLLQHGGHVGHEAQAKVRQHDVAVFMEQNVLRFQILVNNVESVQILQGYQDINDEEFDSLKGEVVAGLSTEEGVEVPAEMEFVGGGYVGCSFDSSPMLVKAAVGTIVAGNSSGSGGGGGGGEAGFVEAKSQAATL
jgi:hypothetical protein